MKAIQRKSYTPKELAAIYRCSRWTMCKWLHSIKGDIGPRVGNFYNPKQVSVIIDKLGMPDYDEVLKKSDSHHPSGS